MKFRFKYIGITLFLLAIAFITGSIINFDDTLNLFIGVCLLEGFFLLYYPSESNLRAKKIFFIHNFLFLLLIIVSPVTTKLPLIALSLLLLHRILQKTDKKYTEIGLLALFSLACFSYLIFFDYASHLWAGLQNIAHVFSLFSSYILQTPLNSNLTYTGLHLSFAFLLFSLVIIFFIRKKRYIYLISSLLYISFINTVYLIIQYLFAEWVDSINPELYINSFHSHFILFILLLPLVFFLFSKVIDTPTLFTTKSRNGKISWKFLIFPLVFLSFYLLTLQLPIKPKGNRILFYDKGYLDWKLPNYKVFGAKNGGMFGLLPLYLKANNYEITRDTVISNKALANTDILVIINLLEKFNENEKQLIWNFVENGGALFAMGDHTGVKQIREPTNDLLQPYEIALNFDCAMPFVDAWKHSMEYFPHYITNRIKSNYESNIFIGASLSISSKARPLITGKYGFSDPGDINAGHTGYLGDMKYQQGEELGDLVLVAEAYHGKGKVLVFGDTSPFQNSALAQSYPFVDKVFTWLSAPVNKFYKYHVIISLLLLITAFLLIVIFKVNLADLITITALICFALFINYFSNKVPATEKNFDRIDQELAYIDVAHLERLSLNQWDGSGYGGLCYNLMRNDFVPLIYDDKISSIIFQCKILTIIAPAKPFDKAEIQLINNFVKQGGILLISTGYEEIKGSFRLLNSFGLKVENIPLGKIAADQNSNSVAFLKAWAVTSNNKDFLTLFELWNYPIILFKPIGKGGVLLIGDSRFLLNDNIEGMHYYNPHNILFFKEMLSKCLHNNNP